MVTLDRPEVPFIRTSGLPTKATTLDIEHRANQPVIRQSDDGSNHANDADTHSIPRDATQV